MMGMEQVIGLKTSILFSALVAVFFGAGFLINESSAGVGPLCFGLPATPGHLGTNRADRIDGTNGDDVIISLGGNDRVDGKKGNDKICTGEGKDKASGGPGDDMINPGPDADFVAAGPGDDMIFARDGNTRDIIDCGPKGDNDFAQVDEKERRIKNCDTVEFPYAIEGEDDGDDNDDDDDKNDKRDKIRKFISKFFKRHR